MDNAREFHPRPRLQPLHLRVGHAVRKVPLHYFPLTVNFSVPRRRRRRVELPLHRFDAVGRPQLLLQRPQPRLVLYVAELLPLLFELDLLDPHIIRRLKLRRDGRLLLPHEGIFEHRRLHELLLDMRDAVAHVQNAGLVGLEPLELADAARDDRLVALHHTRVAEEDIISSIGIASIAVCC